MSESIVRMMQNRPGGGSSCLPVEYEARAYNDNGYFICSQMIPAKNLTEAFDAARAWTQGWARCKVFVNGEEQRL